MLQQFTENIARTIAGSPWIVGSSVIGQYVHLTVWVGVKPTEVDLVEQPTICAMVPRAGFISLFS